MLARPDADRADAIVRDDELDLRATPWARSGQVDRPSSQSPS
jgi:hypothetical protein